MNSEPIVSIRTYTFVFVALLILAGLTTAVADYVDLGVFNTVIAMVIATSKMLLVAMFFMHLWYKPGLSRATTIVGLFWLALLVALSMADTFTRHWTPQGNPW